MTGLISIGGWSDVAIHDSAFTGPDAGLRLGDLRDESDVDVRRNRFLGGQGVSFFVEDATIAFEENIVSGSNDDGLSIYEFAVPGTPLGTIRGNWFLGNAGHGLTVVHEEAGGTGYEIADNLALDNAGRGIDAQGDLDGGGNVAARNTLMPQCVGVTCTTK